MVPIVQYLTTRLMKFLLQHRFLRSLYIYSRHVCIYYENVMQNKANYSPVKWNFIKLQSSKMKFLDMDETNQNGLKSSEQAFVLIFNLCPYPQAPGRGRREKIGARNRFFAKKSESINFAVVNLKYIGNKIQHNFVFDRTSYEVLEPRYFFFNLTFFAKQRKFAPVFAKIWKMIIRIAKCFKMKDVGNSITNNLFYFPFPCDKYSEI